MSTSLVALAVLMGAVTYPSRAIPLLVPGFRRLPPVALEYLRLVGPAVLAALAAINAAVVVDAARRPSFHVGVEWLAVALAVGAVALRRGLLVGLALGVVLAALARQAGLA